MLTIYRSLACAAIWLCFESSISWFAFCDEAQKQYGSGHQTAQENVCIFRGPIMLSISSIIDWWRGIFDKPEDYIALFSALLVFVTIGLVWIGRQQFRDTRILQRAYLSAEPYGIRIMIKPGALVAHTKIINAGNLPAQKIKWRIQTMYSRRGNEKTFLIKIEDLRGENTLAPKSEMIQGNDDFLPRAKMEQEKDYVRANFLEEAESFLYVYGYLTYEDGFSNQREMWFCHRYPCVTYGPLDETPGMAGIYATNGRHHQYGNRTK